MNENQASVIWAVLVEECGADPQYGDQFAGHLARLTRDDSDRNLFGDVVEWAPLGGVGVFHCTHRGKDLRVQATPTEEHFPDIMARIARANERLRLLERVMPERRPTAVDLAVTLAALDELARTHPYEDGEWVYWSRGNVVVHGQRLEIDRATSDALAARLGHAGRNDDESRWLVAGGLEVEYVDGLGWRPVPKDASAEHLIDLRWSERLELIGECRVTCDAVADLGFSFPISGAPETLDAQLDKALAERGWKRVSDIESWWFHSGAEGTCAIVRAGAGEGGQGDA